MNNFDWYFEIKYILVYFNWVWVLVSYFIEIGSKIKKKKK